VSHAPNANAIKEISTDLLISFSCDKVDAESGEARGPEEVGV
jgi:hypothetical protein